jgi:phenylalanyl-tRNA synthetase beta chain
MICDGNGDGMCIAGVFGGVHSGVTEKTKNIFLESAWFHPVAIRKTSFAHGLRTDAATRFEKGVDISNTANVLKRAAIMIKELAGGEIASDVVDVYPAPKEKLQVSLKYHYLKKLSGKKLSSRCSKANPGKPWLYIRKRRLQRSLVRSALQQTRCEFAS